MKLTIKNLTAFREYLRQEKEAIRQGSRNGVKEVMATALRRVVMRTPAASGRARGNWIITFGQIGNFWDPDRKDKSGQLTIQEGLALLASYQGPLVTIWLSNSVPYIRELETGTPTKPAHGMLGLTVAELRARANNSLRKAIRDARLQKRGF